MYDDYVIQQYKHIKNIYKNWDDLYDKYIDIYEYLKTRYDDIQKTDTPSEIIYRIKNNIERKPICECCQKNYVEYKKCGFYKKTCNDCYNKGLTSKLCYNKLIESNINTYGVKSVLSLKTFHDYANTEESKKKKRNTWLEKYGVDNPLKIHENQLKCTSAESKSKKIETCLKKYGVKYNFQLEQCQLNAHSKQSLEKMSKTCIERYGVKYNCLTINQKIGYKKFIESKNYIPFLEHRKI